MRPIFFILMLACGFVAAACTPVLDDQDQKMAAATAPATAPVSVSWQEVLELLRSGRVVMAAQTHDLRVTLTLTDGTLRVAGEPALDAIFVAIAEHAPNAGDIVRVTE